MSNNRFPSLPDPELAKPDYQGDLARLKEEYRDATGHYPTINDPETFHLEMIAYEKNQVIDLVNHEGKQNLLAFSAGARLDGLGALVGVPRLGESFASTVIGFEFAVGHTGFVINAGYQMVAADNQTYFDLTEDLIIEPGQTDAIANFQCETAGPSGNGFIAGQIKTIVTPDPNITSASNLTTSQGGADAELDDDYAYRIYLAPSGFSVCGPYDAYEYFALSASAAIKSVAVWNPAPNEINISAILVDGSKPDDPIKDAILAQCSGKKRVPMGDVVSVIDAVDVTGTATIEIQIYKDYAALENTIKTQVTQQVDSELLTWQTTLSGRDIVIQDIEAICKNVDGVYFANVIITDSAGTPIDKIKKVGKGERPVVTLTKPITSKVVDEYSPGSFSE